jgi:hypothetical protein
MKKRIVVTGIGFLNDWVVGKDNFTRFLSMPVPQTPLEKVDFDAYIDTSLIRRADHISRCALVAAKLALEDANLPSFHNEDSTRIGIVLGSVNGPVNYSVEYHTSLVLGDPKISSPLLFSDSVPNAPVSHISTALGIRGYTTTLSGYCAVMQALRLGAELIEEEIVDLCLVGGADINHDFLVKAYTACLGNSELIAKSFGGSGFLVMESLKHAMQRKTKVYAQLEGVNTIIASYAIAKRHNVSPLRELLYQVGGLKENDCLLKLSYNGKDSLQREGMYLQEFEHTQRVIFDCSKKFGYGFSAAEAFQLILGILGVYASENLSSLEAYSDLKKQPNRMFILHTALAGTNACALFSRYSEGKD